MRVAGVWAGWQLEAEGSSGTVEACPPDLRDPSHPPKSVMKVYLLCPRRCGELVTCRHVPAP